MQADKISDILPEGFVALGFTAAIKCLNEAGEISMATFRSEDLPAWEALGMLTIMLDETKLDLSSQEAD